ncbi:MAG: hypothetical protein QOF23_224 [Solirubrobacterales bacterium]|jgi:UDP:flavonoid glycosyltransferase YjiC (YdhE family)|nr:hypothetical protein [Solirubrobacterales bacterium]
MEAVILTWQGGGATQPAYGLGRALAGRGHRVRILAPGAFAGRAAAAGCEHRSLPAAAEFDAGRGRAAEDQEAFIDETLLGPQLPAALAAECEAEPADAVVVDYLLRSSMCEAERQGVPWFLLVHMTHRFYGFLRGGDEPWGWRWQYEKLNEIRDRLGLPLLPVGPEPWSVAMMRRSSGTLVAMPHEFDDWPTEPPENVQHVGPIFEEAGVPEWDPPWPSDDERPLVVVSLGSTYMHQEDLLRRIAAAVAELDVRGLVLTGGELDPGELDLAAGVWVRSYVPHSAVLPESALVVTHAGIGTLMASFAAGVPALCLPLGRDQNQNAGRLLELGAGRVLPPDADVITIAAAIEDALGSAELKAGAARMAEAVGDDDGAEVAAEAVERAVRVAAD